jgi:hypothetical protein
MRRYWISCRSEADSSHDTSDVLTAEEVAGRVVVPTTLSFRFREPVS